MKHGFHDSQSRLQMYVWLALLVFVVCFVSGCSLTTPTTLIDVPPAPAVLEHAPPEEIWKALAHAVQARTIDSTTRLAQYVVVLVRNGELSQQDVTAFDAAFPQITKSSRALTDEDVNRLVTLAKTSAH